MMQTLSGLSTAWDSDFAPTGLKSCGPTIFYKD